MILAALVGHICNPEITSKAILSKVFAIDVMSGDGATAIFRSKKESFNQYSPKKWASRASRKIPGYCQTPLPYQLRPLDPASEAHFPILDPTIRLLDKIW